MGSMPKRRRLHLVGLGVGTLAMVVLVAAGPGCEVNGQVGLTCAGACLCSENTCRCNPGANCTLGPRLDAGVAGDALPTGTMYDCETQNNCTSVCGDMCTTMCDGQSMCTGTCGRDCTASCMGASTCSLTAGAGSTLACEGGSHCNLDTQDGSTVTCAGASTCNVIAHGSLTLRCDGSSECRVTCPTGECTLTCDGTAACTFVCGETAVCQSICPPEIRQCAAGTTCTVDPCQN